MTDKELAWKIFESWGDKTDLWSFEITRADYCTATSYINEKAWQFSNNFDVITVLNELVEICCAYRNQENWRRNYFPPTAMIPGTVTPDRKWVLWETEE